MSRLWRFVVMIVSAALAGGLFVYIAVCGTNLVNPDAEQSADSMAGMFGESQQRTLRIGWTAWADAEVVTTIAQRLLEQHRDITVKRVMTDIGIQYQAVAAGDLDIMLMAWLPRTHQHYWQKVRNRVVNLGPLYTGRLGWVVPDYVPESELASITDLKRPEVQAKLGNRIQGIDPGSGLMQASEQAMQRYQLDDYKLVAASGAAMTAVLDRAYRNHEWVVATAWQPHWIFARYKLRFLKDPQGVLGGTEHIHAIARQGFTQDFPESVNGFFSRFYLPQDELARLLLDSQENGVDQAVDRYLEQHPNRVRYWLDGEIEEK